MDAEQNGRPKDHHLGRFNEDGDPTHNYWGHPLSPAELRAYNNVQQRYRAIHADTNVRKMYCYTQTFDIKLILNKRHKRQFSAVTPDLLRCLRTCSRFVIVPEFTERQNIHYHGFLGIKDNVKYAKKTHWDLKSMGYYEITKISDYKMWILYMIKDILQNMDILDKHYEALILTRESVVEGITPKDYYDKKQKLVLIRQKKSIYSHMPEFLLRMIKDDSDHESEVDLNPNDEESSDSDTNSI